MFLPSWSDVRNILQDAGRHTAEFLAGPPAASRSSGDLAAALVDWHCRTYPQERVSGSAGLLVRDVGSLPVPVRLW
jgi:hypothetical protein